MSFVGDELSWLLPSADDILALIPSATEVSAPSDALEQISDGGGPEFTPAICGVLYMEQSLASLGARTMSWSMPSDSEYTPNSVIAMQFADEAHVTARMDQLERAASECGEFDYGGPQTFASVVADGEDGARALAGTLNADPSSDGWRVFHGFAAVGNTLVHLTTSLPDAAPIDAEAAVELLQTTAVGAKSELVESLTSTPPAGTTEPEGDASVPWAEWSITGSGAGPIRLGDTYDVVVAVLPDAAVTPPSYPGGPSTFTSPDGTASLMVTATEDGTISEITAGARSDEEDAGVDGMAAPHALEVRIGDPVSSALAAFPSGTRVHISSSGQWAYYAADREGRLLTFHTTRDDTDSTEARIIGITTADTTLRGDLTVE
ncbi:sensor domain-containing protein [Microbacterium sp. UFMG61]|uniref:sensor domain-containing protein n=1 Tax=Microbacterium sp. UFMG61 TaxID=2745935 RepID=UPI00188DDB67|nr:sensor domain-containing protein [Microbacterium sp. UFMG61]